MLFSSKKLSLRFAISSAILMPPRLILPNSSLIAWEIPDNSTYKCSRIAFSPCPVIPNKASSIAKAKIRKAVVTIKNRRSLRCSVFSFLVFSKSCLIFSIPKVPPFSDFCWVYFRSSFNAESPETASPTRNFSRWSVRIFLKDVSNPSLSLSKLA